MNRRRFLGLSALVPTVFVISGIGSSSVGNRQSVGPCASDSAHKPLRGTYASHVRPGVPSVSRSSLV